VEVVRNRFCIGVNGGPVESRGPTREPTILEKLQRLYTGNIQQVENNTLQREVRMCVCEALGIVSLDYDVPDYVVAVKDAAEIGKIIPQARKREHSARSRTGKNFGQ
jgi:hypothetical protein